MDIVDIDYFSYCPACEERLCTGQKAGMIDLGTIHVSNVVTLATRVRADIMRSIAEQRSRPEKLRMVVSAFNSRPVIHVKELLNGKTSVMTFSDVIDIKNIVVKIS